jgi:hypothetical protein
MILERSAQVAHKAQRRERTRNRRIIRGLPWRAKW